MSKRIQVGLKLPESLVTDVDRCRAALEYPPDRSEIIERLLRAWVADQDRGRAPVQTKNGANGHRPTPTFVIPRV